MAVWQDKFIKPNKYSRPQQKLTAVRKIVIHWTANFGATASGHFNYFNNLSGRYASAHFFVDKNEALCIIPLNEIAYHANDGTYKGVAELKPNANYLSVGIELCVEKDGSFHANTIAKAVDVAVELCKRYKLDPMTDIVRHYDVTHKNCPAPWVKDSAPFTAFKKSVNAKLNPAQPAPKPVEKDEPIYRVRKTWADAQSQIGAYSNLDSAKELADKNKGYEVYDEKGKVVYPVAQPAPAKPKSHTVAKDETFYAIAKKYGMSVDELQKFNPRVNSSKLQVGDVIYLYAVPASAVESKPAPKPAPKPTPTPAPKAIGNVVIETGALNIRAGADLDAKIVGQAVKGAKFPVYEQKNGMFRIGDGKWISANAKYSKYTPISTAKYHTVVRGDTVSELAVKYGSTVAEIKAWNKLDSKYTLQLGQKLRVK
jgi:N-acetylmuramoyl-L-alanine amidase